MKITTKAIFGALAEPFPTSDLEEKQGFIYIRARAIMDRLDTILGPGNWEPEFQVTAVGDKARHTATISIFLIEEERWIKRSHVSGEPSMKNDVDVGKAGATYAFRAAFTNGYCRYLYRADLNLNAMPDWALPGGSGFPPSGEAPPKKKAKKPAPPPVEEEVPKPMPWDEPTREPGDDDDDFEAEVMSADAQPEPQPERDAPPAKAIDWPSGIMFTPEFDPEKWGPWLAEFQKVKWAENKFEEEAPHCPNCGAGAYDNREACRGGTGRYPKDPTLADYHPKKYKAPDFKCSDKSCSWVIWPPWKWDG